MQTESKREGTSPSVHLEEINTVLAIVRHIKGDLAALNICGTCTPPSCVCRSTRKHERIRSTREEKTQTKEKGGRPDTRGGGAGQYHSGVVKSRSLPLNTVILVVRPSPLSPLASSNSGHRCNARPCHICWTRGTPRSASCGVQRLLEQVGELCWPELPCCSEIRVQRHLP